MVEAKLSINEQDYRSDYGNCGFGLLVVVYVGMVMGIPPLCLRFLKDLMLKRMIIGQTP